MEMYKDNWKKGVYTCSKCGHKLFSSDEKFDSGTLWPSFRKDVRDGTATQPDNSLGMVRTELLCKKCKQHLGHVFDDGKSCGDTHKEAGRRFCILSEALEFKSE